MAGVGTIREHVSTVWMRDPTDEAGGQLPPRARPAWHARAACRGRADFLATIGRGVAPAGLTAVCATCPVRPDCARYAPHAHAAGVLIVGVWGGVLVRANGTGRPDTWRALEAAAHG
jgi:hypothetical protein